MTATFWTGSSLSFTNGSKTVTVNTGPSLDSVKANSSLTAGNYNEPVEVKSVSGNTITLYNNWPGSTGTTSATIKPSAAAAASAGVAAQQLITEIQSLVGSASATATANSFVKRDSNGRIKAASPSANDDVVNKGYLGSAATRNVGAESTNLMEVGAFGLGCRGNTPAVENLNDHQVSGLFSVRNANAIGLPGTFLGSLIQNNRDEVRRNQLIFNELEMQFRGESGAGFGEWLSVKHSGNTNFNEFGGGSANDIVMKDGVVDSATTVLFYVHLSSNADPSGLTISPGALFKVSNKRTGASLGTTSSFALIPTSSRNVLLVRAQGLTGLTVDTRVRLDISNAGSKITVNF